MRKTFQHHTPSVEAVTKIRRVRQAFDALADLIEESPPSRERSVAMTNLETACMWAIKSLIISDPKSVPQE